jgi:DNA-binding winged helix-turn-helix (wHTH) protein/Tfp pilus assembly protein PilF
MATREIYQFREFTLDVGERRLSRGEVPVHLPPKAHDLLVMLVRQPGRLLTKDELLALIWPDAFVEEGILAVHVSAVRKALGDDARPPTYIETVSRSGYRFIAPVFKPPSDDQSDAAREALRPLEVYELVGRGRSHLMSASYFELPQALSTLRAAIEIDPTYAPAHAGLALTYCAQASLRSVPHREAYAQAKTSALRALALDDACADAQVALGTVLFLSEWDWVGAEKSLRRALEINSTHSEALLHYGSLMEARGKPDQGLRFKQQALERDPRCPLVLVQIASSYWHQRRYDEATAWANRALEADPRHLLAGEFLAGAYWKQGDMDRFLAENLRRAEVFGVSVEALAHVQRVCAEMRDSYATGGPRALARCMLEHMAQVDGGSAPVQRAILCGEAGDLDTAFEHLDRAIEGHDPALVHLAVAPQWDSLRVDPRFNQRLARMGLAPALSHQN